MIRSDRSFHLVVAGVCLGLAAASVQLVALGHVPRALAYSGDAGDFGAGNEAPWSAAAPGLDLPSGAVMVDLEADRAGLPVVGYMRSAVIDGQDKAIYLLRRWTGSAWESAASDLTINTPCARGSRSASIAFDAGNHALIAYGSLDAAGDSVTTVRRFVRGAWQAVGAGDGVLPLASAAGSACASTPVIAVDAADRPVIAYRTFGMVGTVSLQRYEGSWRGLANERSDSFASSRGEFDLRFDAEGHLYFALSDSGAITVRRLGAAGDAQWTLVGGGEGQRVEPDGSALDRPQLRFDASGNLLLAASIESSQTSAGAQRRLYRFDGIAWRTTDDDEAPTRVADAVSRLLRVGPDLYETITSTRSDRLQVSTTELLLLHNAPPAEFGS